MARVQPSPGEPTVARLRLESPLAARAGDRFVVRGYSPVATLGGGVVLDPSPPPRARWLPGLSHGAAESRLVALAARRRGGVPDVELAVLTGIPEREAQAVASASGLVRISGLWRQPPRTPDAKPAEPGPADSARDERLLALATQIESAGLAAPSADELGWNSNAEVPGLLRDSERRGLFHRVDASHWLGAGAARTLWATLQGLAAEGGITPSALRDRTGLSRRYLIPLLEWSDRQGWTLRRGDVRVPGPRLGPPA